MKTLLFICIPFIFRIEEGVEDLVEARGEPGRRELRREAFPSGGNREAAGRALPKPGRFRAPLVETPGPRVYA